jgi:hypothetical protein
LGEGADVVGQEETIHHLCNRDPVHLFAVPRMVLQCVGDLLIIYRTALPLSTDTGRLGLVRCPSARAARLGKLIGIMSATT